MSISPTPKQPALQGTRAGTEGGITRGWCKGSRVSQDAMTELLSYEHELPFRWGKMTWKVFQRSGWMRWKACQECMEGNERQDPA